MIQGTKPQTLGYGLNDSPAGLAAWIVEKFRTWSDCEGDVERSFSKDELLTNVTIYWVTQTINSSIRRYYEGMHSWSEPEPRLEAPVGLALFPKDNPPPREMAERFLTSGDGPRCPAADTSPPWRSRSCWRGTSATSSVTFAETLDCGVGQPRVGAAAVKCSERRELV